MSKEEIKNLLFGSSKKLPDNLTIYLSFENALFGYEKFYLKSDGAYSLVSKLKNEPEISKKGSLTEHQIEKFLSAIKDSNLIDAVSNHNPLPDESIFKIKFQYKDTIFENTIWESELKEGKLRIFYQFIKRLFEELSQ